MLPVEINLMRIVSQGLVDETAAPTPAEVVRRQLAIQGQRPPAIPHAIVVRGGRAGLSRSDVDRAFDDLELVRSWPFRGTLHVTTGADHHWLRAALAHKLDPWIRRIEALGVGATLEAEAERAADRLLESSPAVSRRDLQAAWIAAGIPDEPRVMRSLLQSVIVTGQLVQGPRRAGEHLYVDARGMPDELQGPAGTEGAAKGTPGYRRTLAEIAIRFTRSHGPASAADLARWSGMAVTEARRALEDARDLTADHDVPLARVAVAGRGVTPTSADDRGALYMRADLPDLAERNRRQARRTLYLPAFDELHVGYLDRTGLTDEAGENLMNPHRNGIFHPFVVDRGRMVAVDFAAAEMEWTVGTRVSKRLETDTARAIAKVSRQLAR